MKRPDFVVVGAGAAGATVAARLVSDLAARVLLIEAGPDYSTTATPPEIRRPDFHGQDDALARHPELRWHDLLARRTASQPPSLLKRGRGVGATSTINALMAIRGVPEDYDGWAAEGATGWAFADLLPAFRRFKADADFGVAPWHGAGGLVPVRREPEARWGGVDRAFAEAVTDLGYGWADDRNQPGTTGGSPFALNVRDGLRVSTSDLSCVMVGERVAELIAAERRSRC